MHNHHGTFTGEGGIELYMQSWLPEVEPLADVAILHGFGEYSDRYRGVAEALVRIGCAVHAFDLRGHGRSPGKRGDIPSLASSRMDVDAFIQAIAMQNGGRKLFLYGHSYGGLIAIDYVLQGATSVSGLIASGPLLAQAEVSPLLVWLSKIIVRIYPAFSMNIGLDATSLSRDPEIVRAYQDDPLVHSLATARFGASVEQMITWCQEHATEMKLPIFVVYGEKDGLVPPEGTKRFYNNMQSSDRTLYVVPEGFHEPHNDLEKDAVLDRIGAWIKARA
ncbi:MAG: lysophospholipase [Anaerolineales bacterium]|nr:lysophospholipase [Anaerolineales bacterium]